MSVTPLTNDSTDNEELSATQEGTSSNGSQPVASTTPPVESQAETVVSTPAATVEAQKGTAPTTVEAQNGTAPTTAEAQISPTPATAEAQDNTPEAAVEAPSQPTTQTTPDDGTAQPSLSTTSDIALGGEASARVDSGEETGATVSLMERLLNENEAVSRVRKLEYGQAIEGILMYKDRDDLLVDIGTKSEGTVPVRERQSLSAEKLNELKVGDHVLVVVVRPESGPDGEDGPILSIDKARTEVSWRKLQQQFEAGEVFEVDVVGYNKGGLMVEVEGVRGFIPASQVNALSGIGESEENRQSQMSKLVNTKLLVKIVEVNRDRNRLILSERQAVREQREASKGRLMSELEKDQIRDGVVTTLAKFGAFVDLGGVDGLVHVSELSWARVDDPKQILHVGQHVKVYILDVDYDKQKVALSIKKTQPEPWSQVMNKYRVGEVVEATISQLSNFGAFARLEEGLEGLIHISELADGRVEKPSDIVKAGDKVKVRILRIDPENRRLALSLKRAADNAEAPTEE